MSAKTDGLVLTRLEPKVHYYPLDDLGQYGQVSDPYDGADFRPCGQVRIDGWGDLPDFVRHHAWSNIVWDGRRRRDALYERTLPWVVLDIDGLQDGWVEADLVRYVRGLNCPALIITTKTPGRYRVLLQTERGMDRHEHVEMHSRLGSPIPGCDTSCRDLTDWYRPCVRHDNPDSGRVVLFSFDGRPLEVVSPPAPPTTPLSVSDGSACLPLPGTQYESPSPCISIKGIQDAGQTSAALRCALDMPAAVARKDKSAARGTRDKAAFDAALAIAHLLFNQDSLDAFEGVYRVYGNRCTPKLTDKEIVRRGKQMRLYAFQGRGKYKPWVKGQKKKEKMTAREAGLARAEGRRLAKAAREAAVVGGNNGTQREAPQDTGGTGSEGRGADPVLVPQGPGLPPAAVEVGQPIVDAVRVQGRRQRTGVLREAGAARPPTGSDEERAQGGQVDHPRLREKPITGTLGKLSWVPTAMPEDDPILMRLISMIDVSDLL